MDPIEIGLLITAVTTLIQVISAQISKADNLTDEEKKLFIDRITAAQASVPDWK